MPVAAVSKGSNGTAFLIAAGVVYETIAAACSSPQTAEINAASRSETLMKWVHIGLAQSAILIGVALIVEPNRRLAIASGGGLAAALMYGSYIHANASGLASSEPGTEN